MIYIPITYTASFYKKFIGKTIGKLYILNILIHYYSYKHCCRITYYYLAKCSCGRTIKVKCKNVFMYDVTACFDCLQKRRKK